MKMDFEATERKDVIYSESYGFPRVRAFGNMNSLDYVLYVDTGKGTVYNLFEKTKNFETKAKNSALYSRRGGRKCQQQSLRS